MFFRREVLKNVGAWDPYNVAEDCDIGIRLYRKGYKTAILDSISYEEATSTFTGWIMQRTRWMKGFIQTSIVHLRHPFQFKREIGGWKNFLGFLMIVPGTVVLNFLNFFFWILLVTWMVFQPVAIQDLFPRWILYISFVSFILGNIMFTYFNLIAAYRRERYAIVKYILLSPIYWFMLSLATVRSILQLIAKPHYWEKTSHGYHLAKV